MYSTGSNYVDEKTESAISLFSTTRYIRNEGTHHNPDIPNDVGPHPDLAASSTQRPLCSISGSNLVERQADGQQPDNCVDIILEWAASSRMCGISSWSGFRLDEVDESTKRALEEVEGEKGYSPFL